MSAALLLEVLTMDSERYVASSEVIETIVVDVLAISRFVGCGDATAHRSLERHFIPRTTLK